MIKINLLPQKRAKRGIGISSASEGSNRDFVIGLAALAGAAAVVFLAFDMPKRSHLSDVKKSNNDLQTEINNKNKELEGYAELKKSTDEADERAKSITRLIGAKIIPANILHELGEILTQGHNPTMTEDMARKVGNGPDSDPNRRYDLMWDPSHVWLLSFVDNNGDFTLEGGAQAEADVTQLAKRLQASVYFVGVAPSREERVADRDTGISYYHFTITGKVAY
jgi:Tfp pilus assembly protein PilN